jgi:uncharacterized protein
MPHFKKGIKAALFLLFLVLPCVYTQAREVPVLTGRVNDYAGMLSAAAVSRIDSMLAGLERTDSTQVVVLTVNSLEGDALEDFSIRVAEKWGIGQKGRDNGAILLISKNERKVHIEVGYGLEGRLTDLIGPHNR